MEKLKELILSEINQTMGCTEVGIIGYAAAAASVELEDEEVLEVLLKVNHGLYKNALSVGIPGTLRAGLLKAVLLGVLIHDPSKKLAVFEGVTDEYLDKLENFEKRVAFQVEYFMSTKLYLELTLKSKSHSVTAIVEDRHDNLTTIKKNGKTIFESKSCVKESGTVESKPFEITLDSILDYVMKCNCSKECSKHPHEILAFAEANLKASEIDLILNTENYYEMVEKISEQVFNSSKNRMIGKKKIIYSIFSSGNLGISTMIPALLLGQAYALDERERLRLISLAALIVVYFKMKMNMITTICGSGHGAGAAAAACVAYVLTQDRECIKNAINMVVASGAGVLCDGAKESCAYKVSSFVRTGLIMGKKASEGQKLVGNNGINKDDVELTIQNLCTLNNDMEIIDKNILAII
ncbi:MAG: L-serine ammonia-lyase, iron-sulfur-dependent, subunit alpha [Fusobacteria bacterium]|nr:L-serine ammonia-lyase, iron-sulfur-dependent, subunit alpha [Fusobacteriota bacterium]